MSSALKDVAYFLIYITEAHPTDGWAPKKKPNSFVNAVAHARTTDDRLVAARAFAQRSIWSGLSSLIPSMTSLRTATRPSRSPLRDPVQIAWSQNFPTDNLAMRRSNWTICYDGAASIHAGATGCVHFYG